MRRRILIAGLGKIMLTWASEVAALCCALIYRNMRHLVIKFSHIAFLYILYWDNISK